MKKERFSSKVFYLMVVLLIILYGGLSSVRGEEYPTKPITILLGYAAGGTADTMARVLAKPLGDLLGQPVMIVNKPGGGGGVAAMTLKNSKPDGYTLGITTAITFTFNPHAGKTEYSLDDFKYIAAVGEFQEAFVSIPEKPWKNFKELVEYCKKHPGLTWASMAPIDKVIMQYIGKKEGVEWNPVPTKGGAEVMTAVLGKHVDFGFSGGIHYSYVKAGKMIVLAGCGERRLMDFPEIPTLKELGYDVAVINVNMVAAPKGIPDFNVRKLVDTFSKAVKDPNYVDLLKNKLHFPPIFLGSEQLEKTLREQSEAYRKMVQFIEK